MFKHLIEAIRQETDADESSQQGSVQKIDDQGMARGRQMNKGTYRANATARRRRRDGEEIQLGVDSAK